MNAMSRQNWHLYLLAGVNIGVLTAMGMTVLADNTELDTGPRIVPYNGVLTQDGRNFQGSADFQVTLTDDNDCIFEEAHIGSPVHGGRFGLNIGINLPLSDCIFDADEVFIQVAVRDTDEGGDFRALAGRQRITPVPFAHWAAEGSDMRIDGDITADEASITGHVSALGANLGSLAMTGGGDITTDSGNINTGGGDITTSGGGLALGGGDISGVGTLSGHEGAAVGVGSNLQVAQGRTTFLQNTTDQALGTNGALVVGDVAGINLAIDGNEVMARDNGANSTLFIQREGGTTQFDGNVEIVSGKRLSTREINSLDVINPAGQALATGGNLTVGGKLHVGYVKVSNCSGNANNGLTCTCPQDTVVIGGGGFAPSDTRGFLSETGPVGTNAWRVKCLERFFGGPFPDSVIASDCTGAHALCARIVAD